MRAACVALLVWVVANPAAAQTVPPSAAAQGTGAISGVVVDGSTNRPLSGAIVTLVVRPRGTLGSMMSDVAGRFVFTGLPPGDAYTIDATKFGYFEGGFGRETLSAREGRRIVLADGQWFSDARVILWKPSSIAGTVLDEAGEPIVGTYVRALPEVVIGGVPQVVAGPITTTDDRGEYRISGLMAGRYFVSAPSVQAAVPLDISTHKLLNTTPEQYANAERAGRAPALPAVLPIDSRSALVVGPNSPPSPSRGSQPQAYPPVFHPAARKLADATPVEVRHGEHREGIDFRLRPEPTSRVSGLVVAPLEALVNLSIRLMPPGVEGLGYGNEVATALVGADGTFTLHNVPAGEYTLLAARTVFQYHYSPQGENLDTTLPSPPGSPRGGMTAGMIPGTPIGVGFSSETLAGTTDDNLWARMPLTVGSGDTTGVVLEMKPTVAIRGRIVWESGLPEPLITTTSTPSGEVTTRRDTSLPIYADPADGGAELGMPRGRASLVDQQFDIQGLRGGAYRLRILGAPMIKSITWNGDDYTDRPFDTSEGRTFEGVVVTVTDKVARISGSVRDDRKASDSQPLVIAFPSDRQFWTGYGVTPARMRSALIGSDGTYTLALPAGQYLVVAIVPSGVVNWQDPRFLARAAPLGSFVSIDWGMTKTQHLVVQTVR